MSNKPLTYEDLYEVLREVHKDLKAEMELGGHDDVSEAILAGQILTLKYIGNRLHQRFEKTNIASLEFDIALNKALDKR